MLIARAVTAVAVDVDQDVEDGDGRQVLQCVNARPQQFNCLNAFLYRSFLETSSDTLAKCIARPNPLTPRSGLLKSRNFRNTSHTVPHQRLHKTKTPAKLPNYSQCLAASLPSQVWQRPSCADDPPDDRTVVRRRGRRNAEARHRTQPIHIEGKHDHTQAPPVPSP